MLLAMARCLLRSVRVAAHLSVGVCRIQALKRHYGKHWYALRIGRMAIRQWMAQACHIIGLKISVEGCLTGRTGQLYIANHVSWLDIIAIASVTDSKFLSKHTVRLWPLIGWLTASIGSLFIRRQNRRAFHRSLQRIKERLQNGESICIFPEGTTTDGRRVLPFHSGLLQAAIDAGVAVQPLVLKYQDPDGVYAQHAPYYGRDVFVVHLFRLLCQRETHLRLVALPAMPQRVGANRQQLATTLQQRIARELAEGPVKVERLVLDVA
ncbi:MAG: lysophospholipid acyltransferase family protein [Gammaproteobacteria bacterium]